MASVPRRSYFLCATPRSGSSLLCELLAATGVAAWPAEYFWREDERFWRERWGISADDDYIAAVRRAGTAPYGVFGAKVMWDHMDDLAAKARAASDDTTTPLHELLARLFPNLRYVWVIRRDKLRQAISFVRAVQTGVWARRDGGPAAAERTTFDAQRIDDVRRRLEADDRAWGEYFERAGVEPHRVVYEDLAADCRAAMLGVLRALDLRGDPVLPEPSMHRQADAVTEDWVARYLAGS